MSRRSTAKKRVIQPDIKYNSVLLARFINSLMQQGKKALAEKIIYTAFAKIEKKYKTDGFETFIKGIGNVKPYLEVTSVRVGGANYQVPAPVDERRGYKLAGTWVINAANKRSEKTMCDKLAEELFDAANNKGVAIKKKEDTHKMAESNKAFAHFIQRRGENR